MRKFYGPPIPGSISPVPATEEMTEPVGIKDGQLWTKGPDGGLEERVETLETDVGNLQETATEHGTAINNLEIDMTDAENDISGLQNRMTAAESNIGSNAQSIGQLEFDVSQAQTDIVGLGLSKLDKPTNEGETGDVIVKTANGTEYQSVAPFNPNGTYPNVTVGKAISAKSLENVSEDSGATQTAPFFFQATATANNTEETPTAPVFELKSLRGNTIVYNQLVDGVTQTYPTISGHVYWFKHDPLVSLVTSTGTDINVPTPQSDKLVDLTRWFNGSIPQAILDDPTIFPINYYDGELTYSAGELKNCSCTELKTVGLNLLDESTIVLGNIDTSTGEDVPSTTRCRTPMIRIPNAQRKIHLQKKADTINIYNLYKYDVNGNFLGRASIASTSSTQTLESNVVYVRCTFAYTNTSQSIQPTEIKESKINQYWDGEKDNIYELYISHTYPLVWSGKSAGSAYDEKLPDGTEITRIGSVADASSLNWIIVTTNIFCATFSGLSRTVNSKNVVIPGYIALNTGTEVLANDRSCGMNITAFGSVYPRIYIRDTRATTVEEIKALLANVPCYYELETPTTSEGTPYTSEIEGDDYGTMAFDSTVPVGNEFFYPADYALLIDDLGNYTGYDVTKLMLKTDNVVPSAPTSDGTYVLKCVVSGGTPSYSWIAET